MVAVDACCDRSISLIRGYFRALIAPV